MRTIPAMSAPGAAKTYGMPNMTATLRRVLVRPPSADATAVWKTFGWRREPDPAKLAEEHEAFAALLEEAGAEVVRAQTPLAISPDAIYVYDPALVTPDGALLLRPGKPGRRDEVDAMAADLVEAGVPIAGKLEAPAMVEGGDTVWLDERTLLVGRGYRTNDAGVDALQDLLPNVEVIAYDLPHLNGPGEVLHLMSLISPLDTDLAVVYLPLLPVRLVELLSARGVELVEVPEEEFWTMGPNVLALGPRRALALDGNPVTRERMEAAGVEVTVYEGEELSKLGDGGPTCLTRPLLRA
jgi:N-dimethylarginine dimethylaminohydrolase